MALIVNVKFFAHLRNLISEPHIRGITLPAGATVSDFLEILCEDIIVKETLLDKDGQLKSDITLLKNGREIKFLEGPDTKLDVSKDPFLCDAIHA